MYRYDDLEVVQGRPYYYWLADVDTTGNATLHGPVTAVLPFRAYLPTAAR